MNIEFIPIVQIGVFGDEPGGLYFSDLIEWKKTFDAFLGFLVTLSLCVCLSPRKYFYI